MFNVVSSTALNLNVLRDPSSYDRLLYFVCCGQRNDLLVRMELTSKIRLQSLGGYECAFLRMCTSAPPCGKTLVTMKGPDHLDFNFPGKSFRRELNKRTCCPIVNSFIVPGFCLFFVNAGIFISFVPEFI